MGRIIYIGENKEQGFLKAETIEIGENLFFNIKIGNKAGWEIRYSLDSRAYKPKKHEEIFLKGNNYFLKPIIKNNITIKDKSNNIYYAICKNVNIDNKKDTYLFWDSDLLSKDIVIVSSKNATVIGKGKRNINDVDYESIVIEIFENGSMTIKDINKTYRIEVRSDILTIKEI